MHSQAQLFIIRAVEYEKRAAQNRDVVGTLRLTLLQLADYYRQIAKQASDQSKK